MSSEKYVRIILAENLRFLEEGSSAPSKSGAKVRLRSVADGKLVNIPAPISSAKGGRSPEGHPGVGSGSDRGKYSTEVWLE